MKIISRKPQSTYTEEQKFLLTEFVNQFNALCTEIRQVVVIANAPYIQVNQTLVNGTLNLQPVLANNTTTQATTQLEARITGMVPVLQALIQ